MKLFGKHFLLLLLALLTQISFGDVVCYPQPPGEAASPDYEIFVNGKSVFCHTSKVYDARYTEGSYYGKDVLTYSTVSFGYFDFSGEAEVEVRVKKKEPVKMAVVRPLNAGIDAEVRDRKVGFTLTEPGHYTIEPNGSEDRVLHLFANPMLGDRPAPDAENVIYFGPGIHEITSIQLKDNQTLFIDGGAIVKVIVGKDEVSHRKESRPKGIELDRYDHAIYGVDAKNITVAGRGILDLDEVGRAYGRKNPLHFTRCRNVSVSGIIIRQAPCWNLTLYRCQNAVVDNVKELSCLFNSDGINTVLSQEVLIKNCFLRQRDDGIVMKAMDTGNTDCFIKEVAQEPTTTSNVVVENCTLWSDWGYALGVTYEIRMPVHHIVFRDCDIVHATHRSNKQGVLGILVADKDVCHDVLFENIRVERSLKPLVRIDTRLTPWTVDENLGRIHDIVFRNIQYVGDYNPKINPMILEGRSNASTVGDITFDHVTVSGKKLMKIGDWNFVTNEFVSGIHFK